MTAILSQPAPSLPKARPIGASPKDVGPWWDRWALLESVSVFLIGLCLMLFIYSGTGGILGDELAVPGNDDFYHIKMSAMIPEYGLVDKFPWLQYTYFTRHTGDFVSHHYGFHVLMSPFVQLSKRWTDDYLAGGRAATSTFFALWLMVFNLILISEGVRWRWLWLLVFLILPFQFFGRHVFIRAMSPSLAFMFLIILLLFRRRYWMGALAIAAYTHLYLGAVMFSPVIVACLAAAYALAPGEERQMPWKLILVSALGWAVGLVTYPYFKWGNVFEFLQLQVFGTGLTADIPVGQEWKPYDNVWWFAQMCGPLLVCWGAALWLRTRQGPPWNAKESALLLMNFAHLVLCMKSRRFIEYWPAFCMLSAALIARPIINQVAETVDRLFSRRPSEGPSDFVPTAIAFAAAVTMASALVFQTHGLLTKSPQGRDVLSKLNSFAAWWPVWSVVVMTYFLSALGRIGWGGGSPSRRPWVSTGSFLAIGILFASAMATLLVFGIGLSPGQTKVYLKPALYGGAVILLAALGMAVWRPGVGPVKDARERLARTSAVWLAGLAVMVMAVVAGAVSLVNRQREARCDYNLPAIRGAMGYLKEHSQAGDIVFTDDWDVFPVYFYYNHHNYYIVGLDPKFTHHREPVLWERFVQISRGQAPTTVTVKVKTDAGVKNEKIEVRLQDIRDYFKARWVVTDSDHKPLARDLADAPDFAELMYPGPDYDKVKDDPYLVFRIREPGEAVIDRKATAQDSDVVFLSDLMARAIEQEWGDFKQDRSVEGGQIRLGSKVYPRGLGTHARSRLEYEVPEGVSRFEAVVGINRVTSGRGSIRVSIELDGQTVFSSPLIQGDDPPIPVSINVESAKILVLRASDADDGNKYDHVDWADAKFLRDRPSPVSPVDGERKDSEKP